MSRIIDLNADMGEYASDAQRSIEAALMPFISSCSIACGGHAGEEDTMRATARLAKQHGVSIGAHPSYPDREGFGRRSVPYDADALTQSITKQVASLLVVLDTEDLPMNHIKPHGALYNDAAKDAGLADCVIRAARAAGGDRIIVGPPESKLEAAAKAAGYAFSAEGFVDRLYQTTGDLTPRSEPGAIIEDIDARARQALAIARGDDLPLSNGTLRLKVKTLCIHSDSPGAIETAKAARACLEADGFEIKAIK